MGNFEKGFCVATEQEFTEVNGGSEAAGAAELDRAAETPVEPAAKETPDQKAETAVAGKMAEILARNEARNQKDELEQDGLEGVDNPDGDSPEKPEPKEGEEEEIPAAEKEEPGETPAAEPTPEETARKEALEAFDPNLKQVARELAGWKQQDIDDFIVSNPVLARVTFGNMAAGYNNLSLQYAQAARGGQVAPPRQAQQAAATTQATQSALDELLAKPEKLKALGDIAGEELMNGFIKPMLEVHKQQAEDRQFLAGLRREALIREINTSMEDIGKNGFEDFYGKAGETTQDQHNNRFKVSQVADQIRAGAQLQGVAMTIKEALQRAHLIVTADQVKAQARKEVQKQVVKRSTQITARTTARTKVAPAPKTDDAAMAAVEQWFSDRG
jgi:hypothetical protein